MDHQTLNAFNLCFTIRVHEQNYQSNLFSYFILYTEQIIRIIYLAINNQSGNVLPSFNLIRYLTKRDIFCLYYILLHSYNDNKHSLGLLSEDRVNNKINP